MDSSLEQNQFDGKFNAALELWMYQDKMFWDRINTMYLIHLPILGGAYALFQEGTAWFSVSLLCLGMLVGYMIWDIAQKDKADRDVNIKYINSVLSDNGLVLLADMAQLKMKKRKMFNEYGWHLVFLLGPILIDMVLIGYIMDVSGGWSWMLERVNIAFLAEAITVWGASKP